MCALCLGVYHIYNSTLKKDKAWIFEHDEWRDCKEVQTNLPHGTLLKVDLVVERRGRTKIFRFEAIDLLCWGGQSYTMYSFQGRFLKHHSTAQCCIIIIIIIILL